MTVPDRPALRYYGGKWRLASWIIGHFPAHTCYVEPYGGAASVLLKKRPAAIEVLNDLDEDVVTFFRVLRNQPEELLRLIQATPYARVEYELSFEPTDDDLERARRLFVRSWQGYGMHTGRRGSWRIVKQANQRASSPVEDWDNTAHLWTIANRLKSVFIERADALEVIAHYDSAGTLFYVDPPYIGEHREKSTRYRFEADEAHHRALAETLHSVQGMVVLSAYGSDLYTSLYEGWETVSHEAFTNGNVHRREVLWMNQATSRRRLPLLRLLEEAEG